ncbi:MULTISPECIES: hypothetical protein [unclassified Bradyrhizobium]
MADEPDIDLNSPDGHLALLETIAELRPPTALPGGAGSTLELIDRLPPDLDYSLDSEVEAGALGGDDRAFIDLFDQNTFSWFLPLTRRNGRAFPDIVKKRHQEWRQTASIEDRIALNWGGMKGLRWLFDDVVSDFAYDAIYQQGVGALPDGNLSAVVARMDVSLHPCLGRFTDCAAPIVRRAAEDIEIAGISVYLAGRDRLDNLYAQNGPRIRDRSRRINAMLRQYTEYSVPQAKRLAAGGAPIRTIEQKRKEKRLRKAINRSYALLSSIAGRQTARACIDGDTIVVDGKKFDFRLRVANLRSTAHGAVEVFVTDKDAVELAALCVYIDQTPALDQMAALILNVTSGNEDEIVRRANIIRSTQAAAENREFRQIRESIERPRQIMPAMAQKNSVPDRRSPEEFLPEVRRKLAAEIDRTIWKPMAGLLACEWLQFTEPTDKSPLALPATLQTIPL